MKVKHFICSNALQACGDTMGESKGMLEQHQLLGTRILHLNPSWITADFENPISLAVFWVKNCQILTRYGSFSTTLSLTGSFGSGKALPSSSTSFIIFSGLSTIWNVVTVKVFETVSEPAPTMVWPSCLNLSNVLSSGGKLLSRRDWNIVRGSPFVFLTWASLLSIVCWTWSLNRWDN